MKVCSKCKVEKPRSEFHRSNSRKDGLKCHCKVCRGKARKKLYQSNKEKLRYYVYSHSNAITGELYYIGSGCSGRAWDIHKRNEAWNKVYKDSGSPKVIILESGLTKFEALSKEQELQTRLNPSANFRYGAGKGEVRGKKAGRARAVINCRGDVFETVADAARKFNLTTSVICRVCKEKQNTSGTYPDGTRIKWRYHEE